MDDKINDVLIDSHNKRNAALHSYLSTFISTDLLDYMYAGVLSDSLYREVGDRICLSLSLGEDTGWEI